MNRRIGPERLAGAMLVVALHAAVAWALLGHRLIALPAKMPTVFVELIAPPTSHIPPPVPATSAPRTMAKAEPPKPTLGAHPADTPAALPAIAAPPPTPAANEVPAQTRPVPIGPVKLTAELAVSCPERSAPDYPMASRRRNESGTTLLHVELDEEGKVAAAAILESSGFPRLDEAALATVRRWRCKRPQRDGQTVRATARQAFNFVLQGS